mmetsp:Transcript_13979/g.33883  ORF Transcript_13979/g.33883 Transcript_13979/m.33883 type:complete len:361 (-) Transcript_13979:61-1143(-)
MADLNLILALLHQVVRESASFREVGQGAQDLLGCVPLDPPVPLLLHDAQGRAVIPRLVIRRIRPSTARAHHGMVVVHELRTLGAVGRAVLLLLRLEGVDGGLQGGPGGVGVGHCGLRGDVEGLALGDDFVRVLGGRLARPLVGLIVGDLLGQRGLKAAHQGFRREPASGSRGHLKVASHVPLGQLVVLALATAGSSRALPLQGAARRHLSLDVLAPVCSALGILLVLLDRVIPSLAPGGVLRCNLCPVRGYVQGLSRAQIGVVRHNQVLKPVHLHLIRDVRIFNGVLDVLAYNLPQINDGLVHPGRNLSRALHLSLHSSVCSLQLLDRSGWHGQLGIHIQILSSGNAGKEDGELHGAAIV